MVNPTEQDQGPAGATAPGAVASIVLSILGLVGWLLLVALLLPYESESGSYSDELNNVFAFGVNLVLLVVLGGVSCVLSACGMTAGLVAAGHSRRRLAWTGAALGGGGLALGLAILLWRLLVVT